MPSEQQKGELELQIFRRFLAVASLPYDAKTAKKRNPPEPDILCAHVKEGPVAFELVEICDPNFAQSVFLAPKGGPTYLRTTDPTQHVLRKKIRRKYQTDYPIELLCYTQGRVITPINVIVPRMRAVLHSSRTPFRCAWLFSRNQVQQVWSVE